MTLVSAALVVVAGACHEPPNSSLSPLALLEPPGGATIAVEVTTTGTVGSLGSDIDPDGYVAWMDYSQSQAVGSNGLVAFTGVGPGADGDHVVALYGIASNCTVSTLSKGANNPRAVSVVAGVAAGTDFSVGCVASGGLTVRASTTGVDLPSAYTVTVTGASRAVAPNGMTTFTEVLEGEQTVTLSDIAVNCTLSGVNPRTVTVVPGATASTTFTASCTPTGSGSGTLTVITSSTGSNVPVGYTVTVDGMLSETIGAEDTATFAVAAGAHPVELSAVASNCDVTGDNPRTVSVPADGANDATFELACGVPQSRLAGQGQLGMVSRQGQIFEFDFRADLTGRFSFTDSSNIHPSGNPASLFTDAARDPATGILAYRDASNACADPSRGAEFDAIGRLDEGFLRFYTVQLCDNGPAGSGTDFLSFYVPGEGYGRSGVATGGDVAKQ